jgi:hypothetical protein
MQVSRMVRGLLPVLTRRVSPSPTESTVALSSQPATAASGSRGRDGATHEGEGGDQ